MTRKDKKALDAFRGPGKCEWCGLWLPRRDPHHIIGRGTGGSKRLDIPEALCGVCPAFMGNSCHDRHGNDPRCRGRWLEIVAKREKFESGEALLAWLNMILALPKYSEIPERKRHEQADSGPGRGSGPCA